MAIGWNHVSMARAEAAHSSEQSSSTVVPRNPRELIHSGNYQSWASSVNVIVHRHNRKRSVRTLTVKLAFEPRTPSKDPSSGRVGPVIFRSHALPAPRTKVKLDRGSLNALAVLLGPKNLFGFVKIVRSQTLSDPESNQEGFTSPLRWCLPSDNLTCADHR